MAILSFAQKENIVETVMSSRRSAQKEQLAEMIVQQKSSTVGMLVWGLILINWISSQCLKLFSLRLNLCRITIQSR